MLSIEECRKLIPDSKKYTDKEIAEIRNTLYGLAELALERWYSKKMKQEDLIKELTEFCDKNIAKATQASSGASISFFLAESRTQPTPEELWMKSFLANKGIEFRDDTRNILRGFSVTKPTSDVNKKMLGLIYHDKKDNDDNEDLFEVSSNNIQPLKPREAKKGYPEYKDYHREKKKYLK